jgi:hypothetical protein
MSLLRLLLIDRSNPVFVQSARALAGAARDLPLQIIFVSDKEPSSIEGNLEIVNIHDVAQKKDIRTLEAAYGFSVHRALIPERAFFDYSSFRRCQRYSNLEIEDIERLVTPYLNAFDYLIREKADLVIEGLADNFMTSLAGRIAQHCKKPFFMNMAYYWWPDGLIFADRLDQTCSEIDRRYAEYRANPALIDRAKVDSVFSEKRFRPSAVGYSLKMRLQQLFARRTSYEPFSLRNWVCRRLSAVVSRIAIRHWLNAEGRPRDEEFVLFPLHVLPEATLLGSAPEIADQFALLKNMSMHLPFGVRLYVKEHPAQQLGFGLDYGFYRRLTSLPNVRYFKASANLHEMLTHRGCLGVAVINGTVGLEAAMIYRKPVFVFGPALYGVGDCFIKPKNYEEFFAAIQTIRRGEFQFDEEALYALLQAFDDAVTRADVDLAATKSWTETAMGGVLIIRQFLVEFIERRARAPETQPVPRQMQ